MGGCCCCLQKAEPDQEPLQDYFPQGLEEHEHLASTAHGRSSAVPTGVLVNTNLDISTPDNLLEPPRHVPSPETLTEANGNVEGSDIEGALRHPESKVYALYDSQERIEDELKKSTCSATDDDGCPICLEEYDLENPLITTKCKHDYHLSCILEWMERSETCPICDQIVMLDEEK